MAKGVSLGNALIRVKTLFKNKEFLKKLGKIRKGLGSIAKKATIMGGVMTAALGTTIKKWADFGDTIHKMSLRTGFSTEALSRLSHAAELSGTSLASLETATKRMSRFTEDARKGTKLQIETLEKLGLSVKDFEGLKPEEAFNKYSEAIANVPDPMTRSALAQEVFGRSGADLLPMLAEGAEGFRQLKAGSKNVISQKEADQAASLKDNMERLRDSLARVGGTLAAALAPEVEKLTIKMTEVIEKTREWIGLNPEATSSFTRWAGAISLGTLALGFVAGALNNILLLVATLTPVFIALKAAMIAIATFFVANPAVLGMLIVIAVALDQSIKAWEKYGASVTGIIDSILSPLRSLMEFIQGITTSFGKFKEMAKTGITTSGTAGGNADAEASAQAYFAKQGGGGTVNVAINNPTFQPGQTAAAVASQQINLTPAAI